MGLTKTSKIEAFEQQVESEMEDIVQDTVNLVYKEVKKNAPVDTGFLKANIRKEVKKMAGKVVSGAEYSSAPEFGTYRQPAQRYFRKAIKKGEQFMRKEMKSNLSVDAIEI